MNPPAWNPPKLLPVFFDVPDAPPQRRITIQEGMSPLSLGVSIIRSAGWHAVLGCLLLVVFNTATTLVPLALGAAIDQGIGPATTGTPVGEAFSGFAGWLAAIAALYVVINLTYRFGGRIGWYSVQRAQYELSSRVVERILDVRGSAGGPQMPGRLLSIATSDSEKTCSALYFAIYPLGNLVAVVVAAVSLFVIHPILGITVVVGAPLLLCVMAVAARPLRSRVEREQDAIADAAGTASDLVSGYQVIAGIHARRAAAAHYRSVSRAALRGTLASNTAEGALVGVNATLTALFAGLVTVIAALLTFDGSISVGGLIAAAALSQMLLGPLQILVEEAATLGAEVLASARRVLDLLFVEPAPDALGIAAVPAMPHLRIDSTEEQSIDIRPGEFVVIDPSAVNGDALIRALTMAHAGADVCSVALDGRPLREYDPTEVRGTILVAPHRADLLEATVMANVLQESDDRPRARSALDAACCSSFEHELPFGYDTPIGDGGRTLSGGQRQRVALARALFRESPVLVLHEPTNSVDSATEHDIAHQLRDVRFGFTTVVVTSSPAFHSVAERSIGRRE